MRRTIGLMSGTSLDGVDAAWLETDGMRVGRFGPSLTLPYDEAIRADLRRLLDIAPGLAADDPFLADVTARLTARHAEAVAALVGAIPSWSGLSRPSTPSWPDDDDKVVDARAKPGHDEPGVADLIGFHGQTILHDPRRRRTWQIGDAARLARETGLPVAHDFRSADVAAGGEGAPLAPVFHAALARDLPKPLAVLNIGGVANLTFLGEAGELLAFDTGPGNGPLNDWAMRHLGAPFDANGALATRGS